METTTPGNGTCSLMPVTVPDGTCHWCAEPLPKRRSRWCSDSCRMNYERQHHWTLARHARIRLDKGICQQCGVQTYPRDWIGWRDHARYPESSGMDLSAPASWRMNAARQFHAKLARFNRDVVLPVTPEVNHKVPRVGAGYGFGCWNHVENLETCCHACHVKITNRQRAERRKQAADEQFRANRK